MSATPNLDREWLLSKKRAGDAYEAHDALGMVEHETMADLIDLKRTLARKAGRLAVQLQFLAENIDATPDMTINSLGIVQNDGLDIDRTCAEIGRLAEVLRGIASARKAAER